MFGQIVWAATCLLLSAFHASAFSVKIEHVSTVYLPYTYGNGSTPDPKYTLFSGSAGEAVYEPEGKMIYAIGSTILHAIDASDPTSLVVRAHVEKENVYLSDVEVCGGSVFVSFSDTDDSTKGGVYQFGLYDANEKTIPFVRTISMGPRPDTIMPKKDCTLVVAIENYPVNFNDTLLDPPGGVGLIHFPSGLTGKPETQVLNFTAFDGRTEELTKQGLRWIYRNVTLSVDLEPEWITISGDEKKAYVGIQDNNAIAVVDLEKPEITDLYGLGYKKWSQYRLDPSDEDGGIHMVPWNIYGMYQPDAIQWFHWQGKDYILTANEGQETYIFPVGFSDYARGNNVKSDLLADSLSDELKTALRDPAKLGRLYMSTVDGKNKDGKLEKLHTFGARSFSIWQASDMTQVYDSGSELSEKTAAIRSVLFNNRVTSGNSTVKSGMDYRSDNQGEEPESLAVVELEDHLVLFIGLEKPGMIAVYSIPSEGGMKPKFEYLYTGGIPEGSDDKLWKDLFNSRAIHALHLDSIRFIDTKTGPADYPMLLVTAGYSGTVSLLKVDLSETTAAPAKPETTAAPAKPETTAAPAKPETTAAPAKPETTAAPVKPETTAPPAKPETTAAPAKPDTKSPAPNPEGPCNSASHSGAVVYFLLSCLLLASVFTVYN